MKKIKQTGQQAHLQSVLEAVLEARHGQPYARKAEAISQMSCAEVLEWSLNQLDSKNQAAFFGQLGVQISDETAAEMRQVFYAIQRAHA